MSKLSFQSLRLIAVILLTLTALLSACSPKGSKLVTKEETINEEWLFRRLVQNRLQAEWLSGNTRIAFSDGNQSFSFSGTIHAKKDSLIWMNVRKIGFEVARVLITRDSVYVIDRFNNQYTVEPLDYITRTLQLPADLSMIQDIIWGNPVFFGKGPYQWAQDTDFYHLYNDQASVKSNYWMQPEKFRLTRMSFDDPATARKISIEQDDFQPLNDKEYFSYFRRLNLSSRETGDVAVELQFSNVEYNVPKDIKFEIPDRYTKMP